MGMTRVEGKDKGSLALYALSTCVWCKMMKGFLAKMGIGYDYVDVDTLADEEKAQTIAELKRWNPKCSFPSLVVNGEKCVIGFNEDTLRQALNL
ncbi:MAG: glutaredoxin family protein [Syntrophorhabdus sp.]|nr:glutaredoxin family protein [Syntrophorhabdus sp.]